jgi:SAM-dependent methyltransferase
MLKRNQDAYGQELYHFLKTGKGNEIVERDDGFIEAGRMGAATYFTAYAKWATHQKRAMRYVVGRVLDIGAGAGRCALYLQKKGHKVVAIDNSPLAVKTCRERGVKDARVLPIEAVSKTLGAFDTIIMFGNNFGLFGGPAKARRLLERFARITSPGARIIAETTDPMQTNDLYHCSYHRFNRRRGRLPGQLRIRVRFKTIATPWFDYWLATKGEIEQMLKGTPWRVRRFIDAPGPQYVAIIEKTDS